MENEVISTTNVEEIPREEIHTIPQIQNVVIDKKTNRVKSISQWSDGRKVNPEDYPEDLVVYVEDPEKFLDMTKTYKYKDGRFEEVQKEDNLNKEIVSLEELQKQLKELQQSNVELMNLIATQGIAPIK